MKASLILALSFVAFLGAQVAEAVPPVKEWSFLVFINGNNSLDEFGPMNINSMEEVGSTADLNILVQHASLTTKTVNRLYVTKDNNTSKITSPVVQKMAKVDMGDYKSVVDFVAWSNTNYPAKHVFLAIWDHGSGWRDIAAPMMDPFGGIMKPAAPISSPFQIKPLDISWDEITDNHITTPQMGLILEQSKQILGHNVDIYGSDACLMGMAEIASEMGGMVDTYIGSQDLEPGEGWPYSTFLKQWAAKPLATSTEVGSMLVKTFIASYSGGIYGTKDATLSAFDMTKLPELEASVAELSQSLIGMNAASKSRFVTAIGNAQRFYYDDYVDLLDLIATTEKAPVPLFPAALTTRIKSAAKAVISANGTTPTFKKATGLSIWAPNSAEVYDSFSKGYMDLKFHKNTGWGETLKALLH